MGNKQSETPSESSAMAENHAGTPSESSAMAENHAGTPSESSAMAENHAGTPPESYAMENKQSGLPVEFEILKQLSEGGYGSVYLIQHPTWGRIVFKKSSTSPSSDKDLERMKNEADIHKNLHHPNILKMFDAQFDSKVCGLFLEYMEYGPVDEFIQQYEVTWEQKLQILHDVALAMSYLHHHQPIIIHGDLKCQNILIGSGYQAKLSDFGMARTKIISRSRSDHPGCGTLQYIAPEYLNDPLKEKSEPFDVYGFAISAWEIFSEKRSYYGWDAMLIIFFVKKEMRPEISDMGDNIPQVVVNLIQDCWKQEETSRPTFHDVTGILSDQLCLVGDDLTRFQGRLTNEKPNISTKQIVRPAKQSAINSNLTPGSEIVQTSDMQACITGFRKALTSLSTYLDPEYGLLPCLQFKGIITQAEYSSLEDFKTDSTKTYIELNDVLLLKIINPKFESCCLMFCEALEENDQQHIVKYIMGAVQDSDSDDRVLSCEEIAIINNNLFCLVNLINPYMRNFVYRLVSKQCITNRHKEKIEKFPEASMKMDELLKIIKRRRYRDFRNFKICLHDVMQHKLADILKKSGFVTVRLKLNNRKDKKVIESKLIKLVTGYIDEVDEIDKSLNPEQVDFIKEILRDLEEFDIQLIGNSAWRSIAVIVEFSKLVVGRMIGAGGYGQVYKAEHPDFPGTLAYKRINAVFIQRRDEANLKDEARIHMHLDHPNIVKCIAVVYEPKNYGMILEFMKHGEAKNYLMDNNHSKSKLKIIKEVAAGMKYLHSIKPHAVIHGDLKSENILIDENGIAKVCDFGFSRWKEYSKSHSVEAVPLGTVTHVPPERWKNCNLRKNEKFDVYLFGITMWEILTLESPFLGGRVEQIKIWVEDGQRPDLELIPANVAKNVVDLMVECWDGDQLKRPPFEDILPRLERELEIL